MSTKQKYMQDRLTQIRSLQRFWSQSNLERAIIPFRYCQTSTIDADAVAQVTVFQHWSCIANRYCPSFASAVAIVLLPDILDCAQVLSTDELALDQSSAMW